MILIMYNGKSTLAENNIRQLTSEETMAAFKETTEQKESRVDQFRFTYISADHRGKEKFSRVDQWLDNVSVDNKGEAVYFV